MERFMRPVLVIGGGFAGLATAYRLSEKNIPCMLWESEERLGGHARCHSVDGETLEEFYHHIKPQDASILRIIDDLGLSEQVRWTRTTMAFYVNGRLHCLGGPIDLLRYSPFSLMDKFRFGVGMLKARHAGWSSAEGLNARDWVIRNWGDNIYGSMMGPMLRNKFGIPPEQVSAAFLQGRIKDLMTAKSKLGRGAQFGYLIGGLDRLSNDLSRVISDRVEIRLGTPVQRLEKLRQGFRVWNGNESVHVDWVVNTLPLAQFELIEKNFDFKNHVKYQGAICATLAVEEPLNCPYWINNLDPEINFGVLVNQSALADYQHTILYCGSYVSWDNPLLRSDSQTIQQICTDGLRTMFGRVTVLDFATVSTLYATPVFDIDFPSRVSGLNDTIPGMLFTGNIGIYPHSRTVSTVIGAGFQAADRIVESVGLRGCC
jgi:protoporphyrinogen oxidase